MRLAKISGRTRNISGRILTKLMIILAKLLTLILSMSLVDTVVRLPPLSCLYFRICSYITQNIAMWDLTHNHSSQKLLAEFCEAGKYVAAVCHGPAALLHVTLSNGELLIKDQPITAFSNLEEQLIEHDKELPYALETELIKGGCKYEKASTPWGAHVSVGRGGRLITGQNPASAAGVAEAFLGHHRGGK